MKTELMFTTVLALVLPAVSLPAQGGNAGERKDSIVCRPAAALDSALRGKSIFSLLPSKEKGDRADVTVHQSRNILDAFNSYVASNASRDVAGYRVRIFNDNKQTARPESEAVLARFTRMYPGIPAYRSYTNPFFKVTVGDFRTKSEAMQLLREVRESFPTAFVVKENIGFPVVDRLHPYEVISQD